MIRKVHITLHSALQQAVKIGMIRRNPANFAQPPKEPANEKKILNEGQVSQLLITAQGHRWKRSFTWQLFLECAKWNYLV